jgi:cytochrome c oxidase subunit II
LINFRKGIRGASPLDTLGFQMAAMANVIKDSTDIGHILAYIGTMPESERAGSILGDIKKGQRTYESICGSCHGPAASGNKKMNAPRLNSINDWYLKTQIAKFKQSIRGAHPEDKFGAQMIPMASLLANEQAIDDVVAYIQSTTSKTKE